MFCPSCGGQLPSDKTPFCAQCGLAVKPSAQSAAAPQTAAPNSLPVSAPASRKVGKKLVFIAVLVLVGFGAVLKFGGASSSLAFGDPAVETVRGGVLKEYSTTTVGKAFEGTFQNAKWTSFVTSKGVSVVQFDGTVQIELLKKNGLANAITAINAQHAKGDSIRNACITTLGPANSPDELKRQATESEEQYRKDIEAIVEKVEGTNDPIPARAIIKYPSGNYAQAHRPFDSEPFIYDPKEFIYPFRELDTARRKQLDSEKQALAAVDQKIDECVNNQPFPVKFQFSLSADKKSFELTYVDDAFGNSLNLALPFIYR